MAVDGFRSILFKLINAAYCLSMIYRNKFLWLWVPVIWLFMQALMEILLPAQTVLAIHAEGFIHELLQFGMLCAVFIIAVLLIKRLAGTGRRLESFWAGLMALGAFYVAIEEVSWGQSFFQWTTPAYWQEINNQSETNFHNTSRWLNQIPRYILMVGIAVGGFIIPLIQFLNSSLLPKIFTNLYTDYRFTVTATCLLIVALGHKLSKSFFDTKLFERASEVEEIFMYFFILLYALMLKDRFMKKTA